MPTITLANDVLSFYNDSLFYSFLNLNDDTEIGI